MTAPGPGVASTTLGEGFKLLAKAVLALAQQMETANRLTAIRMAGLDVAQRDLPDYFAIRRALGLTAHE